MLKFVDKLSLLGLLVGVSAIFFGNLLDGGRSLSLLNVAALVIVLGGTVGAGMLQTPFAHFKHALKILKWVFKPPKMHAQDKLEKIKRWSTLIRSEGLLGLESVARSETDPFVKKGLRLLIDGNDLETIRKVLETTIYLEEEKNLRSAKVFESMGGYAPTIGILGAVMGLIHVMDQLNNPSALGQGIATAFVSTIYGVGFANLLFIPLANKLKSVIIEIVRDKEMLLEGIVSIAYGDSEKSIEYKLAAYADHHS